MLGVTEINELLARYGLDARKSLGQNFVADPNLVMKIARLAEVGPGGRVVEIGPGLGSLTLALVDTGAAEVVAVEKDETLVPVLNEVLEAHDVSSVRLVHGDALGLDWAELLGEQGDGGSPWVLVANLPYNVAVPLIMDVLENAPMVQRLVVMVQAEVAERLAAGPGGRTIGIPSIRIAWYASAEVLATVPPEVFVPRPRVDSAVLRITRRAAPSAVVEESQVLRLVARAYRQRRKMLRSTLGQLVPPTAFDSAGVVPTARPEELDVGDWARLTEAAQAEAAGVATGGPTALPDAE